MVKLYVKYMTSVKKSSSWDIVDMSNIRAHLRSTCQFLDNLSQATMNKNETE